MSESPLVRPPAGQPQSRVDLPTYLLAHVPSFGRNPRGSPDFLAYPVPKACMHVLGTRVPRCLGVARSASSPKAAQALGCSLTPGLRISFGRVTCMAQAASVPGLWTLGFLLLRGACVLVWVVVGFGFRLRPATPGWGVGVCVCLCTCSACTSPLLAGVCGVGVCAWARVSAAPRHSWLGCWVVCVLVCAPRLHPATPGWGVRCGCVCFSSGFRLRPATPGRGVGVCVCLCACSACTPPLLAGVCSVGVVLGLGSRLRPATPGWGGGVCDCLCARPACTPPLSAGMCGVGVCVWARVSAAPRRTWPGCCGVRVCVCAPLVPRHSWLGRAVWACLGFGFRLRPATAGWGVGVCVWWCGRSPCTPPLLAGVCGACVVVWALVSAAPRHSWLGCRGLCLLVCAPRLHPATPGWVVRCGGVCLGWGFGCAPPLLAGVFGCACLCACSPCTPPLLAGVCVVGVCAWVRVSAAPRHSWVGCWGVCVLVCALCLYSATPGWGVRCGCLCLGSGFGCAPPLLAGVLGCVCLCACSPCTPPPLAGVCGVGVGVWARVSAAPRHSWLGCWGVDVCVRAPLVPATPGWGVRRACMCLGSGFGCAPPLLAGVSGCVCGGVGAPPVPRHSWLGCAVRVWVFRARVSAAPRHSWLGCWGARVGVRAPPVPRHPWLGCAAWVCVFGLGFRLRPATAGWGVGVCVCWCALSACPPPLLAGV